MSNTTKVRITKNLINSKTEQNYRLDGDGEYGGKSFKCPI